MPEIAFLDLPDGRRIAYRLRAGARADPGLPSRLCVGHGRGQGAGARCLRRAAGDRNAAPGLFGHRIEPGDFEDGTLDKWLEESLAAVDRLTDGPLILVGSSMGGWIALHVALRRPDRVQALVGIASRARLHRLGAATRLRRHHARLSGVGPAAATARRRNRGGLPGPAGPRRGRRRRAARRSHSGPCARCVHPMCSLRS